MNQYVHTSVSVLALLLSQVALAQTRSVDLDPALSNSGFSAESTLERVIVTASRVAESAAARAASSIVIDAQDIAQMNARDVAEILKFQAGIDIGRNGGAGQTASVFVRGSESNHVLVLIDGVRINPATIGVSPLQNINPQMIERIEIIKGPRSTMYGSDAIGGVINIMTRTQSKPKAIEFFIGGGSFNQRNIGLNAGLGSPAIGGNIAASWSDTDGFPTREQTTDDHGHHNISVNGSLWRTLDNHLVELDFLRAEGNTEYADFSLQTIDQDFLNQSIKGRLTSQINTHWKSVLGISNVIDDIEQQQVNITGLADFLETRRTTLDWQNTFASRAGNRIIAGFEAYNEQAKALSFGLPFDEDTKVFSVYSEYAIHGNRYDLSLAARYIDHDDFGNETTWHIDSTYDVSDRFQLLASYGTGFRAPDATDRFGFGGNPNLKPEHSTTYELGLRYRIKPRQLITVRGFSQDIDDLINYVVFDPITFAGMNQNVDRTKTVGAELSYVYVGKHLNLQIAGIIQDPEDQMNNQTLLRRAKRSVSVNAHYLWHDNRIGLNLLATSEREDIDGIMFDRITNPGYVLANLTFSKPLGKHWNLNAKIGNVLNTRYQSADGFNTAERNYYLELKYKLTQ